MEDSEEKVRIEDAEPVKSKAVVKYAAVHIPASFHRLECNTNLNLPPSNWLTTTNSGLYQSLFQSPGFPSFNMAHMFPDMFHGEVDVVSDAENIKKLLKMPYTSKGAVSMIVHKVGNTLLLDEFDIQKYLLRKADDDWKWLRTFILEQLLAYGESDNHFCIKDKSREAIQSKNLLSKFLYYSLTQQSSGGSGAPTNHETQPPASLPLTGPVLPEPKIEENMPDPKSSHVFTRNVVWTFEDIRMLIGTDMPIFGGPNRPCISLRLRDMAKPINILTGIDYWLDNLMCNVPEVVMCYHLDGIVQKYEIIKTEDLPYLEGSQFSPQVVRNVAQNILAFLKANATKAGHTYWLFKGRNDDVVKLYDLTTLCKNETGEEKQENPFTVPVAMLLYTVARNMKNTSRITPKTAGTIRALLDSCIKLLPKEKYPQIVTSSHYILSDLHIPAGIDPKSPKFDSDKDSDTQSVYEEEEEMEGDEDEDETVDDFDLSIARSDTSLSRNVALINICDTLKEFDLENHLKNDNKGTASKSPVPLVATIDERCLVALEHIGAGISCLQFFNSNEEQCVKESEARAKDDEKQRILQEEQNPNMAKPFKPIPLPYESLNSTNQRDKEQKKLSPKTLATGSKKNAKEKEPKNKKKDRKLKTRVNVGEPARLLAAQVEIKTPAALPQHQRIGKNFNTQLFGSWNVHLKLLLLEKASLTYATLAEHNYGLQKYGTCLKAIFFSYRCQQAVIRSIKTIASQKICLLGRAGDCFFQMAKNWDSIDTYLLEYAQENSVDVIINQELEKDLNDQICLDIIEPLRNLEQLMLASCKCYDNAMNYLNASGESEDDTAKRELLRRLGNVRNELGLKYMFWAQEECEKQSKRKRAQREAKIEINESLEETKEELYLTLAMKSYDCLTLGISAFTKVNDSVNLSFMFCNMGRYMRFRAHLNVEDENVGFVDKHQTFYKEAFKNYERALTILGSRKSNVELWDLVNWELSTATFNLAKELQDHSSLQDAERKPLEKEVLDLLHKSLKICDQEIDGTRQIFYAYRSGLLHKRLASFHYNQLRTTYKTTGSLARNNLQLSNYHYEKAASILENLKEIGDFLIVQLERISLAEFLSGDNSHTKLKIKHMQTVLEICLNTKVIFEYLIQNETSVGGNLILDEEFENHVELLEARLHNCLKTLIKLLMGSKDPKKMAEVYKRMYLEALKGKPLTGQQKQTIELFAQHYLDLFTRVKQLECSAIV